MEDKSPFEGWCVLELMGHRRLAGYVREHEVFGVALIRIDFPADDPAAGFEATQFYSASSLYCMTPTTEAVARSIAKRNKPEPVHRWELPAPPAIDAVPAYPHGRDEFEQEEHDGDKQF